MVDTYSGLFFLAALSARALSLFLFFSTLQLFSFSLSSIKSQIYSYFILNTKSLTLWNWKEDGPIIFQSITEIHTKKIINLSLNAVTRYRGNDGIKKNYYLIAFGQRRCTWRNKNSREFEALFRFCPFCIFLILDIFHCTFTIFNKLLQMQSCVRGITTNLEILPIPLPYYRTCSCILPRNFCRSFLQSLHTYDRVRVKLNKIISELHNVLYYIILWWDSWMITFGIIYYT